MWMLQILVVALILGLIARMRERTARLLVVPFIIAVVGLQALKYGLL